MRSLADLGLDSGDIESPLTQTSLYTPESDGEATLLEGDAETAATELADLLRDQGVGQ